MSTPADKDTNTLWGGNGAPEVVDLRLLEDGGERGGEVVARGSVAVETAGEDGERAALSRGADTKARTLGARGGALERGHGAPLEPLAQLGDALRSVSPVIGATEHVAVQAAKERRRGVSMGADTKANIRAQRT